MQETTNPSLQCQYLEPGRTLGIVSRGHAPNQLCLVGTAMFPSHGCSNGGTRVHAGKGLVLFALLAVAANDTGSKAIKLGAVFGKDKVGGEVLSQKCRAVILRDGCF